MEKYTLETRHVSIEFPGVKALDDVNFSVSTGEIRAVVGANGAGKSTLMKVLAGANPTYTGDVLLNGEKVELREPVDAKKLGIQIVYQEVDTALIPTLSVAENIMINEMVMQGSYIMKWKYVREEAQKALDRLNIHNINVRTLVQNLTLAQKQMVLIARAVRMNCRFLILDEPTAPLSTSETEELFRIVRNLRETEHIAVIFISHRLNEILEICENYTVMRNGKIVDNSPVTEKTTTQEIVEKNARPFDRGELPEGSVPDRRRYAGCGPSVRRGRKGQGCVVPREKRRDRRYRGSRRRGQIRALQDDLRCLSKDRR